MMGVDSGNMLTPSVLISTETEDGQASKTKNVFHASERKQLIKFKKAINYVILNWLLRTG